MINAQRSFWQLAQGIVLLVTIALVVGLWLIPERALALLWELLIPVLPASFLVSPMLWRNVCPLATLNRLPGRAARGRLPSARYESRGGVVAIVLLLVLVVLRRVWFNSDSVALGSVIIAVGAAALVLGLLYEGKSGFCNAVCPVLPVERLYGQRPLLTIANPRCVPCTGCTPTACLDLTPRAGTRILLGYGVGSYWLRSSFGAFAATFPGFVLAYFTSEDVPYSGVGPLLLRFVLLCTASYLLVALLVGLLRPERARALAMLGSLAVGIYYWFAAPRIVTYLGVGGPAGIVLRVALLGLVALWLSRALRPGVPNGPLPSLP